MSGEDEEINSLIEWPSNKKFLALGQVVAVTYALWVSIALNFGWAAIVFIAISWFLGGFFWGVSCVLTVNIGKKASRHFPLWMVVVIQASIFPFIFIFISFVFGGAFGGEPSGHGRYGAP